MSTILTQSNLMHSVYRSLLNNSRTYASFTDEQVLPLLARLRDHKEILDPMSGYGGLLEYCSQSNYSLESYNIEWNLPSYYWQYLMLPENCDLFLELAKKILENKSKWPAANTISTVSEQWFPDESLRILKELWSLCREKIDEVTDRHDDVVLAFLLPFVARLSSCVQGNVVTHIKQGGICVFKAWDIDFETYIRSLIAKLNKKKDATKNKKHTLVFSNAKTCELERKKFRAMVTSPPYPNMRDYYKMFAPENWFAKWLIKKGTINSIMADDRLIGSPRVSARNGYKKYCYDDVCLKSASEFIQYLADYKATKTAINDNRTYYIPYYCKYFVEIESAYKNIERYLDKEFEGYIIVVNNTARKKVIPVAESIVEIWERLGYSAKIEHEYSRELSHVGGINPRVKGLSARHMEYTIKVWR